MADAPAQQLKVYCVQPDVAWHDAPANRERYARMIRDASPTAGSLIVLPETAASGFSSDVEAASDSPDHATAGWAADLARETRCTLIVGLITTCDDGRGRNQALVVGPEGEIGRYTKVNPFILGGEARTFEPGRDPFVFEIDGVRICPLICYDLRFPELFRDAAMQDVDVFAVIANWPDTRQHHWHALLRARAIENQAFVIGINRVGSDPHIQYAGGSVVYDYDDHSLLSMNELPGVASTTLDIPALRNYRLKLPYLSDFQRRRRAAQRQSQTVIKDALVTA